MATEQTPARRRAARCWSVRSSWSRLSSFCRWYWREAVQIGRAQNYLLNTDLPLKEIAFRLGFANAANFSAAFRAVFHLPPLAFKRQYEGSTRFLRTGS